VALDARLVIGSVAVMVVTPVVVPAVAKPLFISIVATAVFDELQTADPCHGVVPSVSFPVTVNCWVPVGKLMTAAVGSIVRDWSGVAVTFNTV